MGELDTELVLAESGFVFFFNLFNFGEPSPHPPNVPEPMGTGLSRTDY